jgi:chromosomal replication initiation ATPase DnaA
MIQTAFDFPEVPSYKIDDFIVTKNNKAVFEKILGWPNSWEDSSFPYFLLLYGPNNSGKTHLANIWLQNANATIFAKHQSIETLDLRGNILVENIDDASWLETDLFHIFNFCHETKRFCLFTSSMFPLDFKLADLSSRIKSIDRSCISQADLETVKILLSKEFSKRSLQIEQKVIEQLAEIIPTNFASPAKAVDLLNQTSLATGKAISSAMIKKLFLYS